MKIRQPSYEDIWDDDNLGEALREVSKKRCALPSWTEFTLDEGALLAHAQLDLMHETYTPGPVTEFDITDPKPRHIIAPRLYDRLIHHALMRVTLPVFEAHFHPSSFACRRGRQVSTVTALTRDNERVETSLESVKDYPILSRDREIMELGERILAANHGPVHDIRLHTIPGRGTTYACLFYQKLIRKALGRWGRDFYIISIDIHKYFASIPHHVVIALLDRLFEDRRIVNLFKKIIDATEEGLPIGFLPSQHEANLVGTCFDFFATDTLGQSLYLRYMDDMRILVHTRKEARDVLDAVALLATTKLGLTLSPNKTKTTRFKGSDIFCGLKVYPHHFEAKPQTLRRHERRCLRKERLFLEGSLTLEKLMATVRSATDYMALTGAKSRTMEELAERMEGYGKRE